MKGKFKKIKKQIAEIDALKSFSSWGPEYQLWVNLTEKFVLQVFGNEALKLFKGQQTVFFSESEIENVENYKKELDGKRKVLEGLLHNKAEYRPVNKGFQQKDGKSKTQNVFNVKNSQLHFGNGSNISTGEESIVSKYYWLLIIPVVVGVFLFVINEGQLPKIFDTFTNSSNSIRAEKASTTSSQSNATTTINISDLLSKALALDTVLERQDFLRKYIGSQIYGEGPVVEVSRSGSGFLVDIDVLSNQMISCRQEGSDENERLLPLLKRKTVEFSGVFTFQSIYEHGLAIDSCSLSRQ